MMVTAQTRNRCCLLVALLLTLLAPRAALAHPMGNFSVNHYAKITVAADGVRIDYVLDLAEIPTYQEMQQYALAPGDPAGANRFLARRGAELAQGLHLTLDGVRVPLRIVSRNVHLPPGAGNLPTLKMGFALLATLPAEGRTGVLLYEDSNYAGHAGWKEVLVEGPRSVLLGSSAGQLDRSAGLTNYPTDLVNDAPQQLTATARIALPAAAAAASGSPTTLARPARSQAPQLRAGAERDRPRSEAATRANYAPVVRSDASPAASSPHPTPMPAPPLLTANRRPTARSRFTQLITEQHLSPWFLLTAALLSISLGALHALEPGHGKTIVAAYLVGSRGTARHALLLGAIVTAAHTASVFALGAVTLWASRYILPEQLYPWLNLLSGLTISGLGVYLLLRRATGRAVEHVHAAGSMHGHWFSSRKSLAAVTSQAEATPSSAVATKSVPLAQLFTLGITGGIVPCPAALVVLLSAFALHRVGFGFFLITAFSLGLAAVLVGFGLLMVYARGLMAHWAADGPLTRRWLPMVSAAFITALGLILGYRGLAATGLSLAGFSQQRLGPALFVAGLGLVLGMRHSTDADHVVAISTIVTRERSIRGAAMIGALWGLGHTLTIFAVGCLIILGGVAIPPRIGLSMEFSVGLMLILLGVLNLTGLMQRLRERLGARPAPASGTDTPRRWGRFQLLRPLAIGLVHGLAGSAAVALLVLSTIHNPLYAIGYLVIFGGGTLLGMMAMTAAMSVPLIYAGARLPQLSRYLTVTSGLVSVCFGVFLVYQLGYLNGLFTGHPHWTPQ